MDLRMFVLIVLGTAAVILLIWGMRLQYREFRQDQEEEAEYHAWADSRGVNQLPRKR